MGAVECEVHRNLRFGVSKEVKRDIHHACHDRHDGGAVDHHGSKLVAWKAYQTRAVRFNDLRASATKCSKNLHKN